MNDFLIGLLLAFSCSFYVGVFIFIAPSEGYSSEENFHKFRKDIIRCLTVGLIDSVIALILHIMFGIIGPDPIDVYNGKTELKISYDVVGNDTIIKKRTVVYKKQNNIFSDDVLKYYPMPWKLDEWSGYVFGPNSEMVLDVIYACDLDYERNTELAKKVIEKISNPDIKFDKKWSYNGTNFDALIQYNGENVFEIRGWGHLTRSMNNSDAAKLQDKFGEEFVNIMNN